MLKFAATLLFAGWMVVSTGGCATGRPHRAQNVAQLESGCHNIRLIAQLAPDRFKLQGCGRTYIYVCAAPHMGEDESLVDTLAAAEARSCRAVSMLLDRPPLKTGALPPTNGLR